MAILNNKQGRQTKYRRIEIEKYIMITYNNPTSATYERIVTNTTKTVLVDTNIYCYPSYGFIIRKFVIVNLFMIIFCSVILAVSLLIFLYFTHIQRFAGFMTAKIPSVGFYFYCSYVILLNLLYRFYTITYRCIENQQMLFVSPTNRASVLGNFTFITPRCYYYTDVFCVFYSNKITFNFINRFSSAIIAELQQQ